MKIERVKKTDPRKSELRCHISPETHQWLRIEAKSMGIGAFIEALCKQYKNMDAIQKIAQKMKIEL